MSSLQTLIKDLEKKKVLAKPQVHHAFERVDRKDFVGIHNNAHAYFDSALPIGYGATISQPYTVAYMLDLLDPQLGERVLDVGAGSGWTTALLGQIVGGKGRVYGVERVPELVEMGRKHLMEYPHLNTEVYPAGKKFGLPEHAPYDKILVSARGDEFPRELLDQLKEGGVLVMPIRGSVWRVTKKPGGNFSHEEHPGFDFVPLVKG